MTVALGAIWAQARGGVIGADGAIPWHLPEDLRYFREVTTTHPVVMGRKTWESLPERFRPLPGRRNIVVTRDRDYAAPGASVVRSIDAAIAEADAHADVAWVIGGGAIYAAAMAFLSEVRITDVDLAVDGDTRAPQLSDEWMQEPADDAWRTSSTGIRYRFRVLRRQPSQTTSSSGTSSSIR